MTIDLRNDVFEPVLTRMRDRAESLRNIKRFKGTGIEAWFKVELVAALGNKVKRLCNRGPDIEFEDGTKVELKAATDFNLRGWILKPLEKYNCPCLFLANGAVPAELKADSSNDYEVIGYKVFSDDGWVIGLVKPRQ